MTGVLRRLGAYLLEPADPVAPAPAPPAASPPPSPVPPPSAAWSAPADPARSSAPPGTAAPGAAAAATRAVVLGAPAHVPSVAAACAGELRARAGSATALVCLWRPGPAPPDHAGEEGDTGAAAPAGATTPAARRLAAALEQDELPATACGRLAWLALPDDPARAVAAVRRALRVVSVPVVLAVAGPRPAALEPVLAVADLGLAVLPPDAEEALRDLALVHLPGAIRRVVAPLPPGPPRWAALAGLARLRSLPATASA